MNLLLKSTLGGVSSDAVVAMKSPIVQISVDKVPGDKINDAPASCT